MPRIQGVPNHFGKSVSATRDIKFDIGVCLGQPVHVWHILCSNKLCIEEASRHLQTILT